MPFVTQDHRDNPDISIPGDRCYQYYKQLVDAWKKEPRWTTAHQLYRWIRYETFADPAAAELAWQVFFIKYVMPYEDKKEQENGTI
jgi:hypothetical protein